MRRVPLLVVPLLVALVGSIAAAAPQQPDARATALIARIVQPGLPDQIGLSVAAPPTAEQVLPGYAYPADGSILKVGSADAQVVAQAGDILERSGERRRARGVAVRRRDHARLPRPAGERRRGVGQRVRERLSFVADRADRARSADHPRARPRRAARRLGHPRGARVLGGHGPEAAAVVDRGRDGHPRQADRRSRRARVGQRDRGRVGHGGRRRRPGRHHPRAKADRTAALDAAGASCDSRRRPTRAGQRRFPARRRRSSGPPPR